MKHVWGIVVLCLLSVSANAALLSRLSGQAYYDDVLNITWVADANLAMTSGYDEEGLMSWADANSWMASLNAQNAGLGYLGVNDWRLPTVGPLNGSTLDYATSYNGSTDRGYNQSEQGTAYAGSTASEMAHLYYNTLNNKGYCTLSSVFPSCTVQAGWGLSNTGPFLNVQPNDYWSGTGSDAPSWAWYFRFNDGGQLLYDKSYTFNAWAVRPGDIGMTVDSDADGIVDSLDNCPMTPNPTQLNSDTDTRGDACDNCSLAANNDPGAVPNSPGVLKSQLDVDQDGYGNACDADLNNSGNTTSSDYTILRNVLLQIYSASPIAAAADMNGSGTVTSADYTLLRNRLLTPPGPSGLTCAGTIPCP